jgi:hypothetical protein
MRQMNFDTKLDEVSRKPQSHITQEDAREIQATEVSLRLPLADVVLLWCRDGACLMDF